MEIFLTPLLFVAVIVNSIVISSQSGGSTNVTHHTDDSQRSAGQAPRTRSISPALRQRFPGVLGYRFEDLEFIRLRPYCSPNRVFELRRYVFPPDTPIGVRTRPGILNPMPAGEQIVLSKSNGDVCAIMDKRSKKHICFRATCMTVSGKPKRAKINMNSGKVEELTEEESFECPVSTLDQITKHYAVFRADTATSHAGSSSQSRGPNMTKSLSTSHHSTGSPPPPEPPIRERSRSPSPRQTFSSVLGYRFEDLGSIRLSPHNYPHRIFELRIYAFPPDKPIGLRKTNYVLNSMPAGDQIVLSASNGDVYAILQKKLSNSSSILRPIFTSNLGISKRVKMNMNSGEVEGLSAAENAECPLTHKDVIAKVYRVFHV